jgi:hypothetical protein
MSATDISWRIRTEAFGDVISDALLDEVPEYRRGESRSFTFAFDPGTYSIGSGGFRYGNALWGGEVYDGGTGDGAFDRYRAAREYLDWAGANATGTTITSVPWYREQLPSRADIDSTLVALVPSVDLRDEHRVPGLWGVITGGSDGTLPSLTGFEVTLEVFVLAELREYDDRAAVKTEFEA